MSRSLPAALSILIVAGVAALAPISPAVAADSIVVNSSGNQSDLDAGAGACDVDVVAGEQCTLRAAIETANAQAGADVIAFSFGGTTPVVINVPAALPKITDELTIDGYSVPGSSVNTKVRGTNAKLRIVLKGPGDDTFDGLVADAPVDISGLVLQRFRRGMLFVENGSGSHFWGNFVGTNATGTSRAGNTLEGVHVDCLSAVEIGGTALARRNVVSGNKVGILLCEEALGTTVMGNLIGTKVDGTSDLGNSDAAIKAMGTHSVTVGGTTARAANVIAFNAVGVSVQTYLGAIPTGLRVLRNSMFSNDGLGIDLGRDGITTNDGAGDADKGPNGLQNYPSITRVTTSSTGTTIRGRLVSRPNASYLLLFFSNPVKSREGRTFVASKTVTTDASGQAAFVVKPAKKVKIGHSVVATATDTSTEDTSEFSAPRVAAP